jgi:hypothetical protein
MHGQDGKHMDRLAQLFTQWQAEAVQRIGGPRAAAVF